jgi:hypothetical protein
MTDQISNVVGERNVKRYVMAIQYLPHHHHQLGVEDYAFVHPYVTCHTLWLDKEQMAL